MVLKISSTPENRSHEGWRPATRSAPPPAPRHAPLRPCRPPYRRRSLRARRPPHPHLSAGLCPAPRSPLPRSCAFCRPSTRRTPLDLAALKWAVRAWPAGRRPARQGSIHALRRPTLDASALRSLSRLPPPFRACGAPPPLPASSPRLVSRPTPPLMPCRPRLHHTRFPPEGRDSRDAVDQDCSEWQSVVSRRRRRAPPVPPSDKPRNGRLRSPAELLLAEQRRAAYLRRFRGKCLRCLAPGHRASQCRDPVRCSACWRWGHHSRSSRCPARKPPSPRPSTPRHSPPPLTPTPLPLAPPPEVTDPGLPLPVPPPPLVRAPRPVPPAVAMAYRPGDPSRRLFGLFAGRRGGCSTPAVHGGGRHSLGEAPRHQPPARGQGARA